METESQLRMADVFVGIREPRQARKVEHNLVELLVVAVCGVLAGADDFVQIEEWASPIIDASLNEVHRYASKLNSWAVGHG